MTWSCTCDCQDPRLHSATQSGSQEVESYVYIPRVILPKLKDKCYNVNMQLNQKHFS